MSIYIGRVGCAWEVGCLFWFEKKKVLEFFEKREEVGIGDQSGKAKGKSTRPQSWLVFGGERLEDKWFVTNYQN